MTDIVLKEDTKVTISSKYCIGDVVECRSFDNFREVSFGKIVNVIPSLEELDDCFCVNLHYELSDGKVVDGKRNYIYEIIKKGKR